MVAIISNKQNMPIIEFIQYNHNLYELYNINYLNRSYNIDNS